MSCTKLDGFIGVLGCTATAPGSGIYINGVPGVTSLLAARVANEEQVTGQALLEQSITTAYEDVFSDIMGELAAMGHVYNSEVTTYGHDLTAGDTVLTAGDTFEMTVYAGGKFTKTRLDHAKVFAAGVGTLTISIVTKGVTTPYTYALVEGDNDIELEIDLDAKAVLTISADVDLTKFTGYDGSACSCGSGGVAPLALFISNQCDNCEILYNYRHMLAKMFQLKAATIFFQECIVNMRSGQDARKSTDIAQKMLVNINGGTTDGFYVKGTYPVLLSQTAKAIGLQIRSGVLGCFSCSSFKIAYTTP